jgi:hypothetical protein
MSKKTKTEQGNLAAEDYWKSVRQSAQPESLGWAGQAQKQSETEKQSGKGYQLGG